VAYDDTTGQVLVVAVDEDAGSVYIGTSRESAPSPVIS
jgi:hypothetical protein